MSFYDMVAPELVPLAPESPLHAWDNVVAFDAYTATTAAISRADLIAIVHQDGDSVEQGLQGHHRFDFRDSLRDKEGNHFASVYHGGKTHGERVMLDVKGYRTTDAVRDIRKAIPGHRCTRMDSRMDFDAPGVFEKLLQPLMHIVDRKKLYSKPDGDWRNHPELGRTQYVGSPKSAVRVRLYEKGKEPGYRQQCRWDWARLEVQVRPKKEARDVFAIASPLEAWGAAEWTRELAGELLRQQVEPLKAEATKVASVDESKLYWMCRQYGAPMIGLLHHYQGDLEAFGAHINRVLSVVAEEDSYGRARAARAKAGHD